MKCRECEFASVHKYPRNGNGNSAHVGHFGQEASFCNHPQCPPPGPLGLGVWDYSNQPGNVLGQICPAFGLLWFFIMPLAIWAEDTTRYLIWAYDCAVYHSQEAPPTIAPYSLKSVYGDFICGR